MKALILNVILLLLIISFSHCTKPEKFGKVSINIEHNVQGNAAVFDQMIYQNEAGNKFELSELQWFISDITFKSSEGNYMMGEETSGFADDIHYVDTDIPTTMSIEIDSVPLAKYESVQITFGINEEKNKDGLFTNTPESNMFWPIVLGGGYHYMKFNGYFEHSTQGRSPFNFHLGIGQERDTAGNVTGFVQNFVVIDLPLSGFDLTEAGISATLTMNIEEWFKNPNTWDWEETGPSMMMNQALQKNARENAASVFSIKFN